MRRSMFYAALLSAAALTTGSAYAQTLVTSQRAVSAKGVDFSNINDVRFFYFRLNLVAEEICRSDFNDPLTQMADKACQDEAVNSAVSQVDKPLLNSVSKRPRVELIARNTSSGDRPALLVSGLDK
ncbi:UrcA family protein [Asticcacaulis taihuensis]|uniref:UrcA family protein n=1 Tax=Asticcacaulis taihuensis TaxID=260084 RepID=UPI003F7B7632